jgi:tetratricopeptide (TPR) repeat protein
MLDQMTRVHHSYKQKETQLLAQEKKHALAPKVKNLYNLGLLYFDKRMLVKAEEYFKKALKLLKEKLVLVKFSDEKVAAAAHAAIAASGGGGKGGEIKIKYCVSIMNRISI